MAPSTSNGHSQRLTPIDTCWYHLDRQGRMLDIGALLLFDERVELGTLRDLLVERLLPRHRFRQRVVEGGAVGGAPRWEDDPTFELDAHLRHLAVPAPGDDEALAALAGELMSTPLDLARPLWEIYLLDRAGEASAILARVHHCIGDGFALGHLLLSLGIPEEGKWNEPGGGVGDDHHHESWLHHLRELVEQPEQALDEARQSAGAVRALGHLVMLPFDSASLLTRPLSYTRRAAWSEAVALARVKALGMRLGATVNDVLMTALTGGLRTYLEEAGEPVSRLRLRAIMPVNLRPARFIEEMSDELGNHFGFVFVDLPVDRVSPQERLAALKSEIDRLKESPEAVVVFGLLQALGHTPAFFQHLIEDVFIKKASLVATNVPGPRSPMTFAGMPLKDVLFWVPHPGDLGLGMSIFSYAGRIRIGIRADAKVIPDPWRLARYFLEAFEEMERGSRG